MSIPDLTSQTRTESAELRERDEFLLEASNLMYQRFLLEQVWERMEIDIEAGKAFATHNPIMQMFRQILFSKIVPNINKLGLLSPRLRQLYEELQVIQWEHAPDSATEELQASDEPGSRRGSLGLTPRHENFTSGSPVGQSGGPTIGVTCGVGSGLTKIESAR